MGLMRFRVFPTERITEELVEQSYLSGMDRATWPVRASIEGDELILERDVSDSANLHAPWPVEGYGTLNLISGSLIEREQPYLLPLELARGTIVQVRNQLSEWQVIGLSAPAAVPARLAEAIARFSWAVTSQDNPVLAAEHAEGALRTAMIAGDMLTAAYAEQALLVRRRGGKLDSYLGANLGSIALDNYTAKQFIQSFNAAQVPLCWRETETTEGHFDWTESDKQIEWCHTHGLKIFGGPLLMLDSSDIPDWFYLFEDDFESMLDCVSAFIGAAVDRYRGNVDYWICAGRVNAPDVLSISEQERLRLVARTIEQVQEIDPYVPKLVSFDQPWGEYLRQKESDFPPLHFADTLVRADLGLAGLMMEINVGRSPGGTFPRHSLEFNRLLDTWSLLGMPLWLSLSAPSAYHEDLLAQRKTSLPPGSWTAAAQQAWISRFVPLALAKPPVQGILWSQLRDSRPHEFPHAGLFDDRGQAKLALRTLTAIRQAHLK